MSLRIFSLDTRYTVIISHGMNVIPQTTKFLHELRKAKQLEEFNAKPVEVVEVSQSTEKASV